MENIVFNESKQLIVKKSISNSTAKLSLKLEYFCALVTSTFCSFISSAGTTCVDTVAHLIKSSIALASSIRVSYVSRSTLPKLTETVWALYYWTQIDSVTWGTKSYFYFSSPPDWLHSPECDKNSGKHQTFDSVSFKWYSMILIWSLITWEWMYLTFTWRISITWLSIEDRNASSFKHSKKLL